MNHQVNSELHEERKPYERRIQELESVLSNRQNEVSTFVFFRINLKYTSFKLVGMIYWIIKYDN